MKSKLETDSVSTFLGKLIDEHTTHICGQFVYKNSHLVIVLEAPPHHPVTKSNIIYETCVDKKIHPEG